jgi:hypothetical protein
MLLQLLRHAGLSRAQGRFGRDYNCRVLICKPAIGHGVNDDNFMDSLVFS